nr:MAG TPA: hypothetical protein [Bacteriophage sp.]
MMKTCQKVLYIVLVHCRFLRLMILWTELFRCI